MLKCTGIRCLSSRSNSSSWNTAAVKRMPLSSWYKSLPNKLHRGIPDHQQLYNHLISKLNDPIITRQLYTFVDFFLGRCILFTLILNPSVKRFVTKICLNIVEVILRNCFDMDHRFVSFAKPIRKLLISISLNYHMTRDSNVDYFHIFPSWIGRGNFMYRLLKTSSPLSHNQRMALIMIADLFLYVPSNIQHDTAKNRSIVVNNEFSNDYMISIVKSHLLKEVDYMATCVHASVNARREIAGQEAIVPLPHYSVGKSGVFGPSPLSFLVDYVSLKEFNSGVMTSSLKFCKGMDPDSSDILRYMLSAYSLNNRILALFDSWLDSLRAVISDNNNNNMKSSTGKGKPFEFSGLFRDKNLSNLATLMTNQSFGTSKDRFSTLIEKRGSVSFKNIPLHTLCRNYTGLERSWKFRNILIVNTWVQQSLAYLHDICFNALKMIPQDITFDQDCIYDFVNRHGTSNLISLDLSDATTQQHSSIIECIVGEVFGYEISREYIRVVKEELEVYFSKELQLFYTSGTAQGTRSIWALFVMAHHIIIRKSFSMIDGQKTNPDNFPYILLGDNLTIVDTGYDQTRCVSLQENNVTGNYMMISDIFNGSFDHSSSWFPNTRKGLNMHGVEIAKRYFFQNANITPLPLNFLMPYEMNLTYQDFCNGIVAFLKNGLIPRLRFKSGIKACRRLIISTLKNFMHYEKLQFGINSPLVGMKISLLILDLLRYKSNYKFLSEELDLLINSINSIMVKEFNQESYSLYKYGLVLVYASTMVNTTAKLLKDAIPFKYSDLPNVFYLNYIASKYLCGDIRDGDIFSALPEDLRLAIFSELHEAFHPLKDLAMFREKNLADVKLSLERLHIATYCFLVTLDISWISIVKSCMNEIRSPFIETKSEFGIGKMLSKGYTSMSIYDIGFVENLILRNSKNPIQSLNSSRSSNLVSTYNEILGMQLPHIRSHEEIMIMGSTLHADSYSKNRPS